MRKTFKKFDKICQYCGVAIPANDFEHERRCLKNPKNRK